MDQPLLRPLFDHSQTPASEITETQPEHGGAEAQFQLGLSYANGEGALRDYEQAARWYLKAAEQNHALAQFNLGIMYASGHGVLRNEREAEKWFGKAAQQGDAGAQHRLGMGRHRASIRCLPQNMPESRIEAYKWFGLAAAQGYRGSETARDMVALDMTYEDVVEATRRVDRFMLALRGNSMNQ